MNADVDGNYMSYLLRFDILAHIFGDCQNVLEELGILPHAVLGPKGLFTLWTMKLFPCHMTFSSTVTLHGHTSEKCYTYGPSLGVNRKWTKRSDHAPKNGCVEG